MMKAKYTKYFGDYIDENFQDKHDFFPEYNLLEHGIYPLNRTGIELVSNHKNILEEKIINHFYYREIGFNDDEIFFRQFRTKFYEILPEAKIRYTLYTHNKLIDASNNSIIKSYTLSKDGSGDSGKVTTDNESSAEFQQTPYSSISSSSNYATTRNKDNSTVTTEQVRGSTSHETDTYTENIKSLTDEIYSKAVSDILKNFDEVDLWIISKLEELFMGVY